MQKILRTSSLMTLALATAFVTLIPQHSLAASRYYPKIAPTHWYAAPNSWEGFTGSGFMPNQTVTFSGALTMTAVADASGKLNIPHAFVVPFAWQNTKQKITVSSLGSAYNVPLTITIGSFYPNLEPSTYYAGYGQAMQATATDFAPGEEVAFYINGIEIAQGAAGSDGGIWCKFMAPTAGTSFTVKAAGLSSGRESSRTIKLY